MLASWQSRKLPRQPSELPRARQRWRFEKRDLTGAPVEHPNQRSAIQRPRNRIGRDHEVARTIYRNLQFRKIRDRERMQTANRKDPLDVPRTHAGNAKQSLLRRFVHINGKKLSVLQSPSK